MKVCSLYGVGFYYVPGTDICLKVGAYFRAEYAAGNHGASLTNLDAVGLDGQRTRISGPDYQQRARAFIFLDSRQQTAYGTLRAYMNIGHSSDFPVGNTNAGLNSAAGVYANRAFIQLAGFTWGLATSYYDFYSSPATSYTVPWSSDTGDGGWKVAAYTAQLGNGLSASLSFEEPRRQIVTNTSFRDFVATGFSLTSPFTGTAPAGGGAVTFGGLSPRTTEPIRVGELPTQNALKVRFPDIVANLRLDQAWGSAQIMGALHEVGGGYYGTSFINAQNNGHPGSELGFAVGAGMKINFPMIGPGDYFQAQVNYTEGATRYAAATPSASGSPGIFGNNNGLGVGWFTDGIFCGANAAAASTAECPSKSVQLTTTWSVQAAYEHFWTPSLRTSLVGAYTDVSYNGNASAMLCSTVTSFGTGTAVPTGLAPITGTNQISGGSLAARCGAGSFDWQYWSVSSRTQWNITKDFYIGLEGYYGRLQTMSKGETVSYFLATGPNAQAAGIKTLQDQDVFVYRMRVHRDLVP